MLVLFQGTRERRWPPPLRSDSHPHGLPDLSVQDQQKVRIGNSCARSCARIALCARRAGACGSIENPCTSRLWSMPSHKNLAKLSGFRSVNFDFCMFGTAWRKRTKVLYWLADLAPLGRLCSSRQGLCCKTGKPHQILTGKHPDRNIFWTSIAEPYPPALCALWARCFHSAMAARTICAMRRCCC